LKYFPPHSCGFLSCQELWILLLHEEALQLAWGKSVVLSEKVLVCAEINQGLRGLSPPVILDNKLSNDNNSVDVT
jgi:hypothetical protein